MHETQLKMSRIVLKHDIEANWLKAENFVPKLGEPIVYDIEVDNDGNVLELPEGRTTPCTYERFKIGNGKTLVSDLPFQTAQADWNQNDPAAADYIKNRPFGTQVKAIEVASGTYTSEPMEEYSGACGIEVLYNKTLENLVPSAISLKISNVDETGDEREYNNLPVSESPIGYVAGNLSKLNLLLGTEYEDNGLPFIIGVGGTDGCLVATDMMQPTTHNITLYFEEENIVKLDWKYLPESLPRSETIWKELINEEYTTEPVADFGGAYGAQMWYNEELPDVPEVINLILDGIEYNDLQPIESGAGPVIGNLAMLNPLLGTDFENTGEPFIMGVGYAGCLLATDMTQSTTHSVVVSCPVENIVKLDWMYLPDGVATEEYVHNAVNTSYDPLSTNAQSGIAVAEAIQPLAQVADEQNSRISALEEKHTHNPACQETVAIVNILEAYLNEDELHRNYIGLHNVDGVDMIDWGDGTIDSTLNHTYTEPGEYVIKIYNATNIGYGAFAEVAALTSVFIGDSVTSVGDYAFRNCYNLTSVTIGNSVKVIGNYAFYECSDLTNVVIGRSVTSIGLSAFAWCPLTSIDIPNSVVSIDHTAFARCSNLTKVVIGDAVASISEDAFNSCESLTSVTFKNKSPIAFSAIVNDRLWRLFETCISLAHIYVMPGCETAYKTRWAAEGADQSILDLIEPDREAMMSDLENIKIGTHSVIVSSSQIMNYGKDSYTQTPYIRFAPNEEQISILSDDTIGSIKLDLSELGNLAPAPYVWIKRNTETTISEIKAIQFTAGGEQFYYDNYATDIVIKDIGNAALVYVPSLNICDISFASISIPDLYYKLGLIPTNIQNGIGENNITLATNTITDKAANAAALGSHNTANNREVFVHGYGNTVNGNFAHGEGFYNISHADISHTEGTGNLVGDLAQVAVRDTGEGGHAEGNGNHVLGKYAHAGGTGNVAKGDYSNSDGVGGNDWANPANSEIAITLTQFDEVQYIKNTQVGHGVSYTSSNNLTYISGARFGAGTQAFSDFVSRLKFGGKVKVINSSGLEQVLTVHSIGTDYDYFYVVGEVGWITNDSYIIVEALSSEEAISSGTAAGKGSHVSGYHNYALEDYQTVIGKYNKNKTDTLFEVGNGTSNGTRQNAFEVLKDGRAKVYKAPETDEDVVNKKSLVKEVQDSLTKELKDLKGEVTTLVIDATVSKTINLCTSSFDVVDWGDGVVNSEREHTYESSNKEYVCKIYGATSLCLADPPSGFYGNKNIVSCNIGSTVNTMTDYCFYGHAKLERITIPDLVTSIGYQAFFLCESLTDVTIPDSVTSIAYDAFEMCQKLERIYVPYGSTDTYKAILPSDLHSKIKELDREATMKDVDDREAALKEYVQQYIRENFATLMEEYLAANKATTEDITAIFNEEA